MEDKTAFGRTTPRDEMVIRRWWARKAMKGDLLFSDGETLSGVWGDVVTPLAVWQGWGTFKMIPTQNPKKRSVQDEIRELMPGSAGPSPWIHARWKTPCDSQTQPTTQGQP